jgi:hypothetical protein
LAVPAEVVAEGDIVLEREFGNACRQRLRFRPLKRQCWEHVCLPSFRNYEAVPRRAHISGA